MRAIFFCLFLLPTLLFASNSSIGSKTQRVIYITLDGVRWQDFYNQEVFFKKLWKEYGDIAEYYGGEIKERNMETASVPISLPSYQSQMSGAIQPCNDNYCGRIQVETFPEKFLVTQHLQRKDVAVFSSWQPIEFAAQHIPETIYTNAGNIPVYDPVDQREDDVMKELNLQQAKDPHPNQNRHDKYTFAQAMHYFAKHKPKFLWISLVNADDAAHAVDLNLYHQMLRNYDDQLNELLTYLKNQNLFEHTTIIITTDHGRGNGLNWVRHGPAFPESKRIWAFVINGRLEPDRSDAQQPYYSTLSIRPTVERLLS